MARVLYRVSYPGPALAFWRPYANKNLNAYFAQVATDPHYSQNELENLCCSFSRDSDSASFSPFSDELFITVLGRVRSTSPGPEEIPFWLYKLCAVELGPVVAN